MVLWVGYYLVWVTKQCSLDGIYITRDSGDAECLPQLSIYDWILAIGESLKSGEVPWSRGGLE